MPTSAPMSLTSVISRADEPMSPAQIGYLQAYAQDRAHDVVRSLFMAESESDDVMTRAFLARRLGKKPEQITRWLAVPGNWTLATLAELLGAMGFVPTFGTQRIDRISPSNQFHPILGRMPNLSTNETKHTGRTATMKAWTESKPNAEKPFKDINFTMASST